MIGNQVIEYLEQLYPLEDQGSKDNSGLQFGNPNRSVQKIGISYEKSLNVITYCIENNIDLLITHRPLSIPKKFGPPPKEWWLRFTDLVKGSSLIIYSIHENFDFNIKGTGYQLSKALNLFSIEQHGQYIIGKLKPLPFKDFIHLVTKELSPSCIFSYGNPDNYLNKVGIVAGTAMEVNDINFFYSKSVDCYLSGDMDDFGIRYANDLGIATINVDDYSLEKPGLMYIHNLIQEKFQQIVTEYIDCKLKGI